MSELGVIDGPSLLDRLDGALVEVGGASRAAVATDGDGTLWGGDVCEEFFAVVLAEGLIGEQAREALLAEAHAHGIGVDRSLNALAIARGLMTAYSAGAYPESRVCGMMAWSIAGRRVEEVDAIADRVLRQNYVLSRYLQREALDVLIWSKARDVPVWLVSASPMAVVRAAARIIAEEIDVPVPTVLAMTPATRDGVVLPSIDGIYTYGPGKATALANALEGTSRTIIVGMGDNSFDTDMLRASKVPIAVRPKRALIDLASTVPGLLRLLP